MKDKVLFSEFITEKRLVFEIRNYFVDIERDKHYD